MRHATTCGGVERQKMTVPELVAYLLAKRGIGAEVVVESSPDGRAYGRFVVNGEPWHRETTFAIRPNGNIFDLAFFKTYHGAVERACDAVIYANLSPNERRAMGYGPASSVPVDNGGHARYAAVIDALDAKLRGGTATRIVESQQSGMMKNKNPSSVATTYMTVTLEDAKRGINTYNHGADGCVKNPDLDVRAHEMFKGGLGLTSEEILRQVEFIGRDYGGVAGFKAAYALAPAIANDIFQNRAEYWQAASSASPILSQVPSRDTIEILYRPFVKPLYGKSNWLVWGTKFWHHLNRNDAFPIEDSRVDDFFIVKDAPSVDKYMKFLKRFREFVLSHQEWVPHMRQVDGDVDGEVPCSDNKLWDKMFYGLGD